VDEHRWFKHRIRVRYQETDQMGVVYHTNYLNWCELGRTELIRELGYPYREIESKGLILPVVEAEMKYRLPARYDDEIDIYTRVSSYTNVRMEFCYEIRRVHPSDTSLEQGGNAYAAESGVRPVGDLLVDGLTRHVWVNEAWKPARLNKELPELLKLLSEKS
jgi:acyl-CoA thioester hydrolase